jgi:hypothetical protein
VQRVRQWQYCNGIERAQPERSFFATGASVLSSYRSRCRQRFESQAHISVFVRWWRKMAPAGARVLDDDGVYCMYSAPFGTRAPVRCVLLRRQCRVDSGRVFVVAILMVPGCAPHGTYRRQLPAPSRPERPGRLAVSAARERILSDAAKPQLPRTTQLAGEVPADVSDRGSVNLFVREATPRWF